MELSSFFVKRECGGEVTNEKKKKKDFYTEKKKKRRKRRFQVDFLIKYTIEVCNKFSDTFFVLQHHS